jgi:hypothetical protein
VISLATRRWLGIGIAMSLLLLASAVSAVAAVSLRSTSPFSGWALFALLMALALFNARKKLPFLPLGSASAWLQFHVYAGWLAVALFLLHTGLRVPTGLLEGTLALLFVAVVGSGIAGLLLSRALPARLTTRDRTVLFERIPVERVQLRREVEELALRSAGETSSEVLERFHRERLSPFLARPRHLLLHLVGSERPLRRLRDEIAALHRYASPYGKEILDRIAELVEQKDGLDFQYSLQAALKGWLFVHVPLTWSLLLLAAVHALLVHAFSGGSR